MMISKKLNLKENFIIILFATLPIAIIIGNFFINFYLFFIFLIFILEILETKFSWLKSRNYIILSVLYLYICLNSFINYYINPSFGYDGILPRYFFLKFLILFPAIPLLLYKRNIRKSF